MKRFGWGISILLALWLVWSLRPYEAAAAQISGGSTVTVPAGERIDDDLYVTGAEITIDGEVTRDVFAGAATLRLNGRVGGDLTAAAGTIRVAGPVGGSVRASAATVEIAAPVGWDVAALGVGTLTVQSGATVGHDLALIQAGSVTMDGTVRGAVRGSAETLVLAGQVLGDVDVEAQRIEIRDGAKIEGALRYRSPNPATIAPGATIVGPVEHTATRNQEGSETLAGRALAWLGTVLLRLGWALVAGTLLILLLPRPVVAVSDTLRKAPLVSALWGLAALIGVPIIVLLLAVTVVGIPAALLVAGLYLAILYLSQILVGITLVRLVPLGAVRGERRLTLWLAMLVGTTLVLVFRLLPIPFGWSFWWSAIVGMLALGAAWTALTGWGLRRPAVVEGPAVAVTAPVSESPSAWSEPTSQFPATSGSEPTGKLPSDETGEPGTQRTGEER